MAKRTSNGYASDEERRLIEKLERIEALFARPGTDGERAAAASAADRLRARLRELAGQDPPIEYQFSMGDAWSKRLFIALLRRYGVQPYRYRSQRWTTVMARVSRTFVDDTLWPEFQELNRTLRQHLEEVTGRVVARAIHPDADEEVRADGNGAKREPGQPAAAAGSSAGQADGKPKGDGGQARGSQAGTAQSDGPQNAERTLFDDERKEEASAAVGARTTGQTRAAEAAAGKDGNRATGHQANAYGAGAATKAGSTRPPVSEPPTTASQAAKVGRNDPCPCGSGKKYKKCCLASPTSPPRR